MDNFTEKLNEFITKVNEKPQFDENKCVIKYGEDKFVKLVIVTKNNGTVQRSAFCFVARYHGPNYRQGDIFAPAGWDKPSNRNRANIFKDNCTDCVYENNVL